MLSKEEIEETLDEVQKILAIANLNREDDTLIKLAINLQHTENYICEQNNIINSYIEREQKLIEKLEKDIKENQINHKTNVDGLKDYWKGCIDIETNILEIVKGEKNENNTI